MNLHLITSKWDAAPEPDATARPLQADARLLASKAFAVSALADHIDAAHLGGNLNANGLLALLADLYADAEALAFRIEQEARR